MKVLFVHSGNSERYPVSPFLRAQAESLRAVGVEVCFFAVVGKGLGYLKNVEPLRSAIKAQNPDVVHAHYALCGWVAVLARGGRPLVLSLMGDDAQGTFTARGRRTLGSWFFVLLTLLVQPFVDAIIYKSKALGKVVWRKRIGHLLPNGVRLDQFVQPSGDAKAALGFDRSKKHVLFLGDPVDPNKNIVLVKETVALLDRPDVVLHAPHGIDHDGVVMHMAAADVVTLCSFGEGSPNVIKEAMAMDCPILTVPAGDAAWVVGETEGCFVAEYDVKDFSEKLARALTFDGRTKGRERLVALGLDARAIAEKLVVIYEGVLNG
jgi:teichuronic acid biosynthesis glycosyltransferase TuaC